MEDADRLKPQELSREPDAAKAHEMAIAQDPFETVITNVKVMVEKGGMSEKAAQRIIENQNKRAEKATNKAGEKYETLEEEHARHEEETQVAAGDLALQVTEAMTLSEETSFNVDNYAYKGPNSRLHKDRTISKEDVFKKSLDILGIQPEQVKKVLIGIEAGAFNYRDTSTDDFDDEAENTATTTFFSRVENPDGTSLSIVYNRPTYSYDTNTKEYSEGAPSSLSINVDPNRVVKTGDPLLDSL